MVQPIPDEERRAVYRLLAAIFVVTIGISAILTSLYSGGSVPEIMALGLGGVLTGLVLLFILGYRG